MSAPSEEGVEETQNGVQSKEETPRSLVGSGAESVDTCSEHGSAKGLTHEGGKDKEEVVEGDKKGVVCAGENSQRLGDPSPFSRGPHASESSLEWGYSGTFSLSDVKIPSITESDLCESGSGLHFTGRDVDDTTALIKELQWRVSKASGEYAIFLKSHEDSGEVLKGEGAVKARIELESLLMQAREIIKSKYLKRKQSADLRSVFKDGKAVFQEGILRLSLYEASLATQRSLYAALVAQDDPSRLRARKKVTRCIAQLSSLIDHAPRRFQAAQRDCLHAKAELKSVSTELQHARTQIFSHVRVAIQELDSSWHRDLKQRSAGRPHWLPDSSAAKCATCQSSFTLLRSRHHCRSCGMIFCENCSRWSLPLPTLAYFMAQRVCEMCYKGHAVHALGQQGSCGDINWALVAADMAKALPEAKSLLSSK